MSSSITNNNKPTTTITNNTRSRKSSKRTSSETGVQSPPVILIPGKEIEIISSDDNDLVPTLEPINTKTRKYIIPITNTDIDTTTTTSPSTSAVKPVENIWKAKQAVAKIQRSKHKQAPQSRFGPLCDKSDPESDLETEPETYLGSNPEPDSGVEEKVKPKKTHPTLKPNNRSNKPTETQNKSAMQSLTHEALVKAQNVLVDETFAQIVGILPEINIRVGYVANYRRTLVVQFENDYLVVDHNDKSYEFSRFRFFTNSYFQNIMRKKIHALVPQAWIVFTEGRDVNTYCIKISLRRVAEA